MRSVNTFEISIQQIQFASDTIHVVFHLSHLLLHRDSGYPWVLIRVVLPIRVIVP